MAQFYNNVILGLEIQGKDKRSIRRQVDDLLQRYGLWDFRHHYPHQLSGGMRQRVALIRTLAINPDILLLDEPFAALDYQTRLYLEDEVATILKGEGKTVILVTHDISEAVAMSDRVIVLSKRPGRVKADKDYVCRRQADALCHPEGPGIPPLLQSYLGGVGYPCRGDTCFKN